MNFLDRAIAAVSPERALDRVRARLILDQLRAYDGALMGRRGANWLGSNASANAAIKGDLARLRARARDVSRNTWWGARIKSVFTAHAVGAGIVPRCKDAPAAVDLWRKWGKRCDAEGQLNVDGLIALAVGTIFESGEVLPRLKLTQRAGMPVPLELQLLEPDHLDGSRDRASSTAIIDQGIQYDAEGRRTAYWILPQHPGASPLVMRQVSISVPAANILHTYKKDRIGQGRGVPWVAPVLLKGKDIADLEEAVIVKARIEACLALLIKTNNPTRTLGDARMETSSSGAARRLETLSPGMVRYLDNGEEATVVNPSSSLAFEQVMMNNWMTLAAGAGLTYDQVTGDLSRANYSSLRAGKIEFRRLVEQFQWLTLVPMLLDPLWDAFIAAAVEWGALPKRRHGYPVEWIMPAHEPIDPLKDLQADILAVRSGRMTWPQFCAAWGFDPDKQLDEIDAWFKKLDAKGIALDCDPRRPMQNPKSIGSQGDPAPADNQGGDSNANAQG